MSQGTKLAAFGSKVERGAEWQNIKNEKRLFRYQLGNQSVQDLRETKRKSAAPKTAAPFGSMLDRFSVAFDENGVVVLKTAVKHRFQHSPAKVADSIGLSRNVNQNKTEGDYWIKEKNKRPYFDQSKVGFDTTDKRFRFDQVFHGQSLQFHIPGPGHYSNIKPKQNVQRPNQIVKHGFQSAAPRFTTVGPNSKVGPGTYDSSKGMVKRSHNVTMEQSYFV